LTKKEILKCRCCFNLQQREENLLCGKAEGDFSLDSLFLNYSVFLLKNEYAFAENKKLFVCLFIKIRKLDLL